MSRNPIWPFTEEQRIINRCAMRDLPPTRGPVKLLLRVETEYFVAGAIWQQIGGPWSCIQAAPILHWMKGMNASEAKIALLKMGADFQWVSPPGKGMGDSRQLLQVATQQMEGTNPLQGVTNPAAQPLPEKETAAGRGMKTCSTHSAGGYPDPSGLPASQSVIPLSLAVVSTAGGTPCPSGHTLPG